MKTVEVAFGTTDPFSPKCVVHYENALKDASKLVKVRALVLCSPHNPLGTYRRHELGANHHDLQEQGGVILGRPSLKS